VTNAGSARYEFLEHPGPLAFAHRGGAGAWPENTWPAFEHAAALGYRYLETDAHVTADGVVVAFHDHSLDRVTDRTGRIAALRWADVRRARIAGAHEPVRLDELLAAFPDRRFNLDPKDDAVVDPLAAVIARTGSVDRVCIGSFRERRLMRMRALLGPRLCTAAGPPVIARLRAESWGVPFGVHPAACVQVPARVARLTLVDRRFVRALHRRGLGVHVWTVDDPAEMNRLLDLGARGIMTDQPAVLRDVLVARGTWYAA
jgi:glycerophosphoryl diester phosphodiesterase